ncbi:MAG: hypothetical protein RMJ05_06870 [Thermomicrobium sp.]|nr:hypothetical protein [Thermomicrobium sp.]MDW8059987.1 hypothetical protein [Thermomicrobium sp.]
MTRLFLRMYTPLPKREPIVSFPLELEAERVEFTTAKNAGFATLRVTFASERARRRVYEANGLTRAIAGVKGREHIELWAGRVVWEGQLTTVERDNGQPRSLDAEGYAVALQERLYRPGKANPAQLPAREIILAAARTVPFIVLHPNDIPGPTATYPVKDFHELPTRDVIEKLVQPGDGDGVAWSYYVWEGPRLVTVRHEEPGQPDYVATRYEERVTFTPMLTRVTVQYQLKDEAGNQGSMRTPQLVNTSLESDLGRQIERIVEAGTVTGLTASRYAAYLLGQHAGPLYSAKVGKNGLYGFGGRPVIPWLVRAGQWVQAGEEMYVIARTQFRDGELEVELGSPWPSEAELFRNLVSAVNRLQRRQLPLSGGRW